MPEPTSALTSLWFDILRFTFGTVRSNNEVNVPKIGVDEDAELTERTVTWLV